MSDKLTRRAKLLQKAAQAERHLVLRSFKEAEVSSLELLHSATYVPGCSSELQRASFVLVQALFEQCRYKEVLEVLEQHYGGIVGIDFDVMLLWAALAVDAKMTEEAASTLDNYIHMRNVSEGLQLSADQSAAAARMYAIELLAREAGKFKEAESWLRGSAWLSSPQREQILKELDSVQKKSLVGQSVEPGTPKQPTERPLWTSSSDAQNAVGTANAAQAQQPAPSPSAGGNAPLVNQPLGSKGADQSLGTAGSSLADQRDSEGAVDAGNSRDAGASCSAHESPAAPWYGDISGSLSRWWLQEDGYGGLTQPQLAAMAAGSAVVLYAIMAERRTLLSGLRRAAGGLLGGISELSRLAMQLNPNPLAAAMAARQ